jgi:hypothetical protein
LMTDTVLTKGSPVRGLEIIVEVNGQARIALTGRRGLEWDVLIGLMWLY